MSGNALAADLARTLNPALMAPTIGFKPDPWQHTVLEEKAARTLLNCHRQAGKSTVAGVAASNEATYNAGSITLLISPSQRQSGELFRKVANIYKMLWKAPAETVDTSLFNVNDAGKLVLQADEIPAPESETALTMELENGSRIISLPGKDDSTIRGYSGVSLIIVDEAAMVTDNLVNAISPMMAVSGGRLMALSTPKGKRGWFYEAWKDGPEYHRTLNPRGWLKIKAIAPDCPRISAEFLAEELARMGPRMYSQEYMGEFLEMVGQVFSDEVIAKAFDTEVEPLF